MAQKREENLQKAVCRYLKLKYPNVMFVSDAGGVRLTKGQAISMKEMRSHRGWPDLFIAEPRGIWNGLFIELKREGERVYLKDGSLSNNAHIQEQDAVLTELGFRGYKAVFAVGIDEAMKVIDDYLSRTKK